MKRSLLEALLFICILPGLAVSQPELTQTDVFAAGQEGYHTFRIPAIQTAPDGSLIAVCEARKYNRSDPGHNDNDIDLVSKRSIDDGKTWSKLRVLDDPGERWSACNPAMLVDRPNDRLWLFHCRTKPGRSSYTSRPGTDDCQAWARYTADNGATWSEPVDISKVARDVDHWGGSFYGPGGGIQDRNGRLIVPLARTTGRKNDEGKIVAGRWNAFAIYSDDHGKTWERGELLPEQDWGDENQLVELADGRILVDVRQDEGPHRWLATSTDGGETWSRPRPGQQVTPVCCAIERYTLKSAGDDRNRILWTGPKGPGRSNLVVRVSYDEGEIFTNERTITDQNAAYSDITILKDNTVGVIWERGVKQGYEFVTFTRFNLEFLESSRQEQE